MALRHQRVFDRLRELPGVPGKPDIVLRTARDTSPAPVLVGHRLVKTEDAKPQIVTFHSMTLCSQYGSIVNWTPRTPEDSPA